MLAFPIQRSDDGLSRHRLAVADDSIPESASPADVGGFAIALPEFHKVFANSGGHYVEIEGGAFGCRKSGAQAWIVELTPILVISS